MHIRHKLTPYTAVALMKRTVCSAYGTRQGVIIGTHLTKTFTIIERYDYFVDSIIQVCGGTVGELGVFPLPSIQFLQYVAPRRVRHFKVVASFCKGGAQGKRAVQHHPLKAMVSTCRKKRKENTMPLGDSIKSSLKCNKATLWSTLWSTCT